jgi:hypothetical protein
MAIEYEGGQVLPFAFEYMKGVKSCLLPLSMKGVKSCLLPLQISEYEGGQVLPFAFADQY